MELIIRVNNEIKVSSDTLYLYPEFQEILRIYGKHEDGLLKIIKYIYFTSSTKATPYKNGYNEKETHQYAIKYAELNDKFVVTPEIKAAQKLYRKETTNPVEEYLNNFIQSLRVGNKVCKRILDKQDVIDDISDESLASITNAIEKIISLSDKINKYIPDFISNLKALKAIEEEEALDKSEKKRGGDIIPDSYLQDPEIEEV